MAKEIKMSLAPIVIFAFNRPESFKTTIQALKQNREAIYSDLFVFVDGAREGRLQEHKAVEDVKRIANTISGFKSVTLTCADRNKGLGPSIITGVTKVINQYGKVIVLEDDLLVQPNFLTYMNEGLEKLKNNSNVFSICGYTNKIKLPYDYSYNTYYCVRSSSWGWATWKKIWDSVDWELTDWGKIERTKTAFNRWGGSDCFSMLKGWKEGHNKSWAIRFCYSQFLQKKVCLFPVKSLVNNNGFDGNGTNCKKWSRFKFELMSPFVSDFRIPESEQVNKIILKQSLSYHSLLIRIWSKIMYMTHK